MVARPWGDMMKIEVLKFDRPLQKKGLFNAKAGLGVALVSILGVVILVNAMPQLVEILVNATRALAAGVVGTIPFMNFFAAGSIWELALGGSILLSLFAILGLGGAAAYKRYKG